MSPTVFRYKNFRFHFFSREEPRMHVHVISGHGEAKFWMEPDIGRRTLVYQNLNCGSCAV